MCDICEDRAEYKHGGWYADRVTAKVGFWPNGLTLNGWFLRVFIENGARGRHAYADIPIWCCPFCGRRLEKIEQSPVTLLGLNVFDEPLEEPEPNMNFVNAVLRLVKRKGMEKTSRGGEE